MLVDIRFHEQWKSVGKKKWVGGMKNRNNTVIRNALLCSLKCIPHTLSGDHEEDIVDPNHSPKRAWIIRS